MFNLILVYIIKSGINPKRPRELLFMWRVVLFFLEIKPLYLLS